MLELLYLAFEFGIIATKCFIGDTLSIKFADVFVIELEPIVFRSGFSFSFFYETIVVTTICSTLVHHDSRKCVLEVVTRLSLVVYYLLVFIKILLRKSFFLHFFDQILPFYVFLAVFSHIEIHRKFTVVVKFYF